MPRTRLLRELGDALASAGAALLNAWRRMLAALLRAARWMGTAIRHSAAAWGRQWPLVSTYLTSTRDAWVSGGGAAPTVAATFGIRAFVAALAIGGALAVDGGESPGGVLLLILAEVLWAAARYTILVLLVPPRLLERPRLTAAFLAGLIPYAIALTPFTRLVALASSWWLTARGLDAAGVGLQPRRAAVAWAFGGQFAVLVVGWLLRGALVAVVAL